MATVHLQTSTRQSKICSTTLFHGIPLLILLYEIFIKVRSKLKNGCCYLTGIIHRIKLELFLWYLTVNKYLSLNHIQVIPSWWCGDFALMHSCVKKELFFKSGKLSAAMLQQKHFPIHCEIAITDRTWMDSKWARRKGLLLHLNRPISPTSSKSTHVWGTQKRVFGPIIFLVALFQETMNWIPVFLCLLSVFSIAKPPGSTELILSLNPWKKITSDFIVDAELEHIHLCTCLCMSSEPVVFMQRDPGQTEIVQMSSLWIKGLFSQRKVQYSSPPNWCL